MCRAQQDSLVVKTQNFASLQRDFHRPLPQHLNLPVHNLNHRRRQLLLQNLPHQNAIRFMFLIFKNLDHFLRRVARRLAGEVGACGNEQSSESFQQLIHLLIVRHPDADPLRFWKIPFGDFWAFG